MGSLIVSWLSVIAGLFLLVKYNINWCYYFVADSNKPLAVLTAVCAFMFFKNLHIGYSKIINMIAASAYGVLLIHANSDTMRQWLWKDTLHNVDFINSNMLVVHAVCSVIGIYAVCTAIDMIRLKFIEKPFFKWYDKRMER